MDSLPVPCTQPVYNYLEIEDRPARTTLNGGINNSTQTVVLAEAVCAAGEVIQVNEETILLGTTADNLTFSTCTRNHGSGGAAAHLTAAPVISLGKPRVQGHAAATTGDRMIQPNDVTQYTLLLSKDVIVSDTSRNTSRYGREGDEISYQEIFQQKVLKKELQAAVMWGKAVAPATTATAGEMDGIYERIQSTSSTDLSDASQTHNNMEDAIEAIQDYGGGPKVVACGLYAKRVFDSWGVSYIRHDTEPLSPTNMQYGTSVTKLFLGGVSMDILVCPDFHAHIGVLDTTVLGCGPMIGMAFHKKELDDGGSRKHSFIQGEYTCAVPNPRRHYLFTSVKFT